jgi:hypothetical protein
MDVSRRSSARVQLSLPVRVRGMSTTNKFFDETTETILISEHGFMTKIKNLVELDGEVHVVSTKNDIAGTFRVVWVNPLDHDGFHHLGLQMIEVEGDMWGLHFPDTQSVEDEASTEAWLECTRCHQKQLGGIPLSELEYLERGVVVSRACEKCKATTPWVFAEEVETAAARASGAGSDIAPVPAGVLLAPYEPVFETAPTPSPAAERTKSANDRTRIRVPLKLAIKITRDIYGTSIDDICETIDVSRNGASFLTSHNYYLGETVKVVLPYKKSWASLPVLAKVVRKDKSPGSFDHVVAVQMEEVVYIPGLEEPGEPAPVEKKRTEQRSRSRVPLKFSIKVIRRREGRTVEDMGETINISRAGAYFQSLQSYTVGEIVEVIMPYKPGDVAIPVSARVVRQDEMKGSFNHAVAIRMGEPEKPK